jgi:exodeoxyribonuclease-3
MVALKIATWNVNSLRMRLPAVLAWLNAHQPDALCLQETKVEDALFPEQELLAAGWHSAFYGQKSYNGVAILTRSPATQITHGFANTGYDALGQARTIAATVQGIRIISAYVPNGESLTSPKFEFKEAFYQALTAELASEIQAHPHTVLCGDFNIAADERDVPNPAKAAKDVLFTPQERAWLNTLQQQTGLTDAFRLIDQTPNVYSWFDYRTYGRNPNTGMRIDYHFVSPALHSKVMALEHHIAERAKPQPSDHVPVLLTLKD